MKAKRVGKCMRHILDIVSRNPNGVAVIDVASRVGPHGSLMYGYQTVRRAVAAGIVVYGPPLAGRRGKSLKPVV